jgi:hypothetical protein
MTTERYAFKMKLNPGMEAEYRKRHDEIWPELVALLHEAPGSQDGGSAEPSGDETLVGSYGRYHAVQSR